MEIADDAGTLLVTFILGDGTMKPFDIFNTRVQDLHSVCVTAVPRLRASQNYKELVHHALDILEHVKKAISVYNDIMDIAEAKFADK